METEIAKTSTQSNNDVKINPILSQATSSKYINPTSNSDYVKHNNKIKLNNSDSSSSDDISFDSDSEQEIKQKNKNRYDHILFCFIYKKMINSLLQNKNYLYTIFKIY